jgi:hypothetical protein
MRMGAQRELPCGWDGRRRHASLPPADVNSSTRELAFGFGFIVGQHTPRVFVLNDLRVFLSGSHCRADFRQRVEFSLRRALQRRGRERGLARSSEALLAVSELEVRSPYSRDQANKLWDGRKPESLWTFIERHRHRQNYHRRDPANAESVEAEPRKSRSARSIGEAMASRRSR